MSYHPSLPPPPHGINLDSSVTEGVGVLLGGGVKIGVDGSGEEACVRIERQREGGECVRGERERHRERGGGSRVFPISFPLRDSR